MHRLKYNTLVRRAIRENSNELKQQALHIETEDTATFAITVELTDAQLAEYAEITLDGFLRLREDVNG